MAGLMLQGDIERGGVIASLVVTRTVLDPADAAMICCFIGNKFRGDPALFADGYATIEQLSGWRGIGLDARFEGYEMQMGVTTGADCARPFAELQGIGADGAISADGRVMGTYCCRLLGSSALRGRLLQRIGSRRSGYDHARLVDDALDQLGKALEQHLDIDGLIALAKVQP